jgi:antitoxin MazE
VKTQVSKWGNSLAVRIPRHIVEELNLKVNDAIAFSIENGKVTLALSPALPEFTLDELLGQVTEESESEIDWGKPMGSETW